MMYALRLCVVHTLVNSYNGHNGVLSGRRATRVGEAASKYYVLGTTTPSTNVNANETCNCLYVYRLVAPAVDMKIHLNKPRTLCIMLF